MKKQEQIVRPFGRVAKRIIIEADDNGTIRTVAFDVPLVAVAGRIQQTPMDSREMVLALMKVVMDYTSALFMNLKLEGTPNNGQQTSTDPPANKPS